MEIKGQTINSVYKKLIKKLLKQKELVNNTRELQNCSLIIKKPSLQSIQFYHRHISTKYLDGELTWYWSADNSVKFISKYASMWSKLTDDGITSNSAYGYVIFKKYSYNQLEQIIELLSKDISSRRAVLNLSDPYLNKITTHDLQCTIAIQFLIRQNKLDMIVYMRSNDVMYGLPYDYIFFETIHQYISDRLNVQVGTYYHHASSMHMYNKDYKYFKSKQTYQCLNIDKSKYTSLYEKYTIKENNE